MPYSNYLESSLAALVIVSPALGLGWWIRSRALGRRAVERPLALASIETLIVVYLVILVGITLLTPAGMGRNVEWNPFVGLTRGWSSDVYRRLFWINFLALSPPLAVLLVVRFRALQSWWRVGLVTAAIFAFLETMQFVVGNRVASTQDVMLAALGAIAAYLVLKPVLVRVSRLLLTSR